MRIVTTAFIALVLGGCFTFAKVAPGKPVRVQHAGSATFFLQGDQILDWDSLTEELERHEASRDGARSANRWLLGGGIVEGAGLGATIGGLATIDRRGGWAWAAGGIAFLWGGHLLERVAQDRMAGAVEKYNAALGTNPPAPSASVLVSPWLAGVLQRGERTCPVGGLQVRF